MVTRPFDPVAELQNAFQALIKNWILAVPTGLAALVATAFFVFVVAASLASFMGAGALGGFHPGAAGALLGVGGLTMVIGDLIIALLFILAHATVMGGAENVWHGQPADLSAGLSKAFSRLPTLIGLFLIAIVAAFVCSLLVVALGLGLLLGLLLLFFWMYALPAIVISNQGAWESLGTSYRLVRANFGPSITAFLGIIVAVIIGQIIVWLFHAIPPLAVVVALIVGGFTYAYAALVSVRFYDLLRGSSS